MHFVSLYYITISQFTVQKKLKFIKIYYVRVDIIFVTCEMSVSFLFIRKGEFPKKL